MGMSPKARSKARRFAMQAVYQWAINGTTLMQLKQQYQDSNAQHKVDWPFFNRIVEGVFEERASLDQDIAKLTTRPFETVNPVELAILRLAALELKLCLDVPAKVIIDEYIELGHQYGAEEGYKFINSVTEKLWKQYRPL
jgi:N utilization substance protein B